MFLLDTNIFIQHDHYTPLDIHVSIWKLLANRNQAINVKSIIHVYNEIDRNNKALYSWAKQQKANGFFIDTNLESIQQEYRRVVNYVEETYDDTNSRDHFLNTADAWLIAAALHYGYGIVTYEKSANGSKKEVKIPDVAEHFNITCLNFHDFCRQHNITF